MPNTTAVRTAQVGAAPFFAGKNKVINGDFNINQRNVSTITNPSGYAMADRWLFSNYVSGTNVCSMQSFTPGTAPVAGYEAQYFARFANSGQSSASQDSILIQKIEDVRTFANQTVTVSFWAKCDVTSKKIAVEMVQNFGSGGSPSSAVNTYFGQVTLTTSWARYTVTGTVPSISGKTIGTTANTSSLQLFLWNSAGSDYNARTGSIGIQNNTFDMWGVQVEAGSTATAFQTATGTLQGELAACQRYLPCFGPDNQTSVEYYMGYAALTNTSIFTIPFHVQARVAPTGITIVGTIQAFAGNTPTNVTPAFDAAGVNCGGLTASHTITQGQGARLNIIQGAKILFTGCEL